VTVESVVRAMTKPERVAYLEARGWYRLSARDSQCWLAPGWRRLTEPHGWLRRGEVVPGDDRGFYSLAAAIRTAVGRENP
jgi:hypothetical protein